MNLAIKEQGMLVVEEKVDTKLQTQIELELLLAKNQLLPRMRSFFENHPTADFQGYMKSLDLPVAFGIDMMVQIALHKRADLPTMIGTLWHHLKDAQATADMLYKFAQTELIVWDTTLAKFVVVFEVDEATQAELDFFQYPLPMLVEPKPVLKNSDTGYINPQTTKGSIILKNNYHEGDVCLDHINRMNRIRFSVNLDVAVHTQNQWDNLDKPKPGESRKDYEKRLRAFQKYNQSVATAISIMEEQGNSFYFTHAYDKRGRTYCRGYQLNYQSNSYAKAIIELADKEIIP